MSGNNPIGSRAEDRLGRARFADELAVSAIGCQLLTAVGSKDSDRTPIEGSDGRQSSLHLCRRNCALRFAT
jgi:hypothetical protein